MEHAVAGDAGVVDQHLDRTEIGRDLCQSRNAGFIRRHIPLVDVDPGLGLELGRDLVVAAVIGRNLVAGPIQSLRDRRADAARTARYHSHPCHQVLLHPFKAVAGSADPMISMPGRAPVEASKGQQYPPSVFTGSPR